MDYQLAINKNHLPELSPAAGICKKLPAIFILDVSESMKQNNAIGLLFSALELMIKDLKSNPTSAVTVEIMIITYGSNVQIIQEFAMVEDIVLNPLNAGGYTAMGRALDLALEKMHLRRVYYQKNDLQAYRGVIVNLTDGAATDSFKHVIPKIHDGVDKGKYIFINCGVGSAVDYKILSEISPKNFPPFHISNYKFEDFFKFITIILNTVTETNPGQNYSVTNNSQNVFQLRS